VFTPRPLEDERGVDRQAIRELLALSPAERVDRLIATVAIWSEVLAHDRRRAAAGRTKDTAALPYLESLRAELNPGPGSAGRELRG
jgi:hypothetical protein